MYVFRTIQYSLVLILIGLALLVDPSGMIVFHGGNPQTFKEYYATRRIHAIIIICVGVLMFLSAMLVLFLKSVKKDEKIDEQNNTAEDGIKNGNDWNAEIFKR
jgi:preprotein translocase subunit SecG